MSRSITEINVHCSATRPGWMAERTGADRIAEIRRWHVQTNGWRDIGYHYLIDRDGQVYDGRPVAQPGAFEPKVNANAIGICLLGGYAAAATDAFEQHYTPDQGDALRGLVDSLREQHPGIRRVTGHNDYAAKGCPGFKVQRWLDRKPPQRSFAESGTAIGSGTATAAAGGLAVVEVAAQATSEVRTALADVKTAGAEVKAAAADTADPLRWVLIVLVIAGAAFALYRRWVDWQAGRR